MSVIGTTRYQFAQINERVISSFTLRCERCGILHTLHDLKKQTAKKAFYFFGWRVVEVGNLRRLLCHACAGTVSAEGASSPA